LCDVASAAFPAGKPVKYPFAMEALKADSPHIIYANGLRWTAPPNWPEAPEDWTPDSEWRPEPAWGPPPPGWAFLRLSDCAADANLPLEYREPDVDEKFRAHIADDRVPATAFVGFLGSVVDIVSSAFKVAGAAGQAGSDHREAALRSVRDATDVLEEAARAGRSAPFVFFACMQDALSAVRMFAAAADRSPDDGLKSAGLAAFAGES
jgi:hypothetical protein